MRNASMKTSSEEWQRWMSYERREVERGATRGALLIHNVTIHIGNGRRLAFDEKALPRR